MTRLTTARLSDAVWRRLVEVLGVRCFANGSGSALVDWAVEALEAGWESTRLNMLAGIARPPNEFEVERLVERILEDLGVESPDKDALAHLYANAIARGMLAGDTSPHDGVNGLYRLWLATGCPAALHPWCGLGAELDLAEGGVHGEVADVERRILGEARRMVGPEEAERE